LTGLILCQGYIPENNVQIEHKTPISDSVFPGGWGLTTSSYIAYDYTTSGQMDM